MATSKEQLQIIVNAQGIAKTKAQLKAMDKATGGASKSFAGMAMKIGGATVALMALTRATSFAIRVGKDFEQGMANVKAISGATGTEFMALEQNARKLGASTKFTATEVSGLQTEFSKLGFTATEINKVTEGTLALAAATGSDLATSAAVGGATLRGFGLDASETGRVTDVMAKSFSSSALDMQKFSDSMKYVAPIAKIAGVNIEGTTAILGQLANAGIDGSMAGTSLRKILLEAGKEGSKLAKKMGGPIKSFEDFQEKLRKLKKDGFDPLVDGSDAVGQRAVTAFSILLDGADSVGTLNEALMDAGGSAQRMADIQLDTLEGRLTIMKSATEGLGIALFDHLAPGLKESVEGMTKLISSMTKWLEIPASKKLEDEVQKVNNLSFAIQMSEQGSENRNRLIAELNSIHPDLLKGLDDEEITQGKLTDRLKEYNTQQSLKIALVKVDEETLKIAERKAEVDYELAASTLATTDAMRKFSESFGGIIDPQKSLEENYVSLNKQRDAWVDGLTREQRYEEEIEKQIDNSASARMELITAYKTGSRSLESHAELLIEQEILAGKLTKTEEIQARKREILNEMYSTDPTPTNGEDPKKKIIKITEFASIEAALHEEKLAQLDEQEIKFHDMNINAVAISNWRKEAEKKMDAEILSGKLKHFSSLAGALSGLVGTNKANALQAGRLAQVQAAIDTYAGANKALAQGGMFGWIQFATILASGLANVAKIENQMKTAATGMDEVVTKPTMILAGEGNRAEHIGITPLEGPNENGPQQGSSITLNISAPLVDETVVESIIPAMREALRRGETLDFN